MPRFNIPIIALALAMAAALPAAAHVSLENGTARIASNYKAILRVPHGCDGKATTAIRVRLPEGVISAKPMPKPGWTLEKTMGEYAKAYQLHGEQEASGVREITWSGGRIGDDEYDEFVFRVHITDGFKNGEVIAFPVIQMCEGGATTRWIEVPADGKTADDYEHPAPTVTLTGK